MVWSGRGSNQQTSVFVGSKDVIVWSAGGGGQSTNHADVLCCVSQEVETAGPAVLPAANAAVIATPALAVDQVYTPLWALLCGP